MLVSIFANKELIDFVSNEIKIVWKKLKDENSPHFFDFVKIFFRINPTETLIILKRKIEEEKGTIIDISNTDTLIEKNYQKIDNDIIEILSGFSGMKDFPTSLELFFQYYLKCPNLYKNFYYAIDQYFRIDRESLKNDFYTQINFFRKLEDFSNKWQEKNITLLFLEVVENFLKFFFNSSENGRKIGTIEFYNFSLKISKSVQKYRKFIWESLLKIAKNSRYKNKIWYILYSYGTDRIEKDFEKIESIKKQSIEKYLVNASYIELKCLIDVYYECENINKQIEWEIIDSLRVIFDVLTDKIYVNMVKYYIDKNTPLNLDPSKLVKKLFKLISKNEIFNLINNSNLKYKNSWLYAYFSELPKNLIEKEDLQNMYTFLEDTSDKNIIFSSYYCCDINFLEKYEFMDENVFIKCSEIILSKNTYSIFMIYLYFQSLFNLDNYSPKEVIIKFSNNLKILEKIYFTLLLFDENSFDYNGLILKELYLTRPAILNNLVEFLICRKKGYFNFPKKYQSFFELPDYIYIYNKFFQNLSNYESIFNILEIILLPSSKKIILKRQDDFIKYWITEFSNNELKIECLFNALDKLNNDAKKEYIHFFIKKNESFEDFKKIPLIPTFTDNLVSGSFIPLYSSWIEYLKSLLPIFVGYKWLEHKGHIEKQIDYLRDKIKSEETKEFLEVF